MDNQSGRQCGCCEGVATITSAARANRPGLAALAYRYGTHATVLQAMLARLSSSELPALRGLTTRASDDPAIALLDAWATVADVLTFYQERLANEGYLCTATERRSVLELARLVGYALRPGVAASTYLAYTVDENFKEETPIQAGARAQSVPGPGETQQTFETSEPLKARAKWSYLQVRLTQPQSNVSLQNNGKPRVYLKGIATNLKPNDLLLIEFGTVQHVYQVTNVEPEPLADWTRVELVQCDAVTTSAPAITVTAEMVAQFAQPSFWQASASTATANRIMSAVSALVATLANGEITAAAQKQFLQDTTLPLLAKELAEAPPQSVNLKPKIAEIHQALEAMAEAFPPNATNQIATPMNGHELLGGEALLRPASLQPASAFGLERNLAQIANDSDIALGLTTAFQPGLRPLLVPALANANVTTESNIRIHALRQVAPLFGHNAPREPQYEPTLLPGGGEFPQPTANPNAGNLKPQPWTEWGMQGESNNVLFLNRAYQQILPDSFVVIQKSGQPCVAMKAKNVDQISRHAYGLSGETTRITLNKDWKTQSDSDFKIIRETSVFVQSEELALAPEPITKPVCKGANSETEIELDGWYRDLQAGRWLIITGERTDIPLTSGVQAAELAMIAEVKQKALARLPGDKLHTFITLAQPLAYCYQRDTVKIYGNVVKATHGETRREVLGSGQASQALQQFTLKQPPLTFVADANPTGAASTLEVFVNDVRWHEADTLAGLQPNDRNFVTKTDDEGKTSIICGNGRQGARLPTGSENIQARYRSGIGKAGNLNAGQLSLLGSATLGVKEVINPLAATGGADRESRDQARRNAPLAVMALDRLVSARDYADFARTFAGIAKAYAVELPHNQIHLTIAGLDDIAIAESSDLWRNLRAALRRYGDQQLPFKLAIRELKLLVLSANVSLHPDYQWEKVEPQLRAALLERFSFEQRELGQDATLSEAVSVMQRIPGVEYVDVDTFGGVPEKDAAGNRQTPTTIAAIIQTLKPDARVTAELTRLTGKVIRPAQLVYLTPEVEATLILNEVKR